jgi:segregation and condensation protein A
MPLPALHISAPGFEGSIEELIHAVRTGELALASLPMAAISESVLAWVMALRGRELIDGADTLDILASLIRLKSRALLPEDEVAWDEQVNHGFTRRKRSFIDDLRALQYAVDQMRDLWAASLPREELLQPAAEVEAPAAPATLHDLIRALEDALRLTLQAAQPLEIEPEEYPFDRLAAIIHDHVQTETALGPLLARHPHIAAGLFLAALELSQLGQLDLDQEEPFGAIRIQNAGQAQRPCEA